VAPVVTPTKNAFVRYTESSPRWLNLTHAVCIRAGGQCEICLRATGEKAVHVTFERLFNEGMTDLLWLCGKCAREFAQSRLPMRRGKVWGRGCRRSSRCRP